ncbi:phosphatase PAP2 family protein [Actinoplanes sp. NPDC023714]|uniref:phosphatase PAP2 family protein n=1 Tax=Actinoplanes sp. NPDC023714 TaxID=3154322 RepID=UPI0033CC720C
MDHIGRRLTAPFLIGVLATLGTLATYHVFVRTISGQWLDTAAMLGTDISHPRLAGLLSRSLDATNMRTLLVICLIVAAIGLARRRADLAAGAAVLVLGANITTQLLKSRLPRPALDGLSYPNSLPSGHTTAAASVAFAVVLVLPEAVRGLAALAGSLGTAVIAIGTVWARWHRPSDAIAALLVVLAWGALVAFAIRLRPSRTPRGPSRTPRPSRIGTLPLLVTGAVAVPVTVAGLLFGKTSSAMATLPEPSRLTFVTGAAGIAAVVAVSFLAWLWLTSSD